MTMEREDESEETASSKWAKLTQKKLQQLASECKSVVVCNSTTDHVVRRILNEFACLLEKLELVMQDLQQQQQNSSKCLRQSYQQLDDAKALDAEIEHALSFLREIHGRSLLYLLICSLNLLEQTKNFATKARALLSKEVTENASDTLKENIADALRFLGEDFPQMGPKDQILFHSFQDGALDSITSDHALIIKLSEQIAESLGMSLDSEGFRTELEKLRCEKSSAVVSRGKVHSLYLEQFIALLDIALKLKSEKSVANVNAESTRSRHSNHHRDVPMLPLQSFICPITKDVMQDPVQIDSGQTYERTAIERWFRDGHTRCPTGVKLKNTKMKPNYALKQSIEEWRDMNYNIRLETAYETLRDSQNVDCKLKAVHDIQALCEEHSLNKYKVANKELIPILVKLTESPTKLATKAFSALAVIAKDNNENQEIMVSNGIISKIVSCLGQQKDEAPQAVYLMRLLSENTDTAEKIAHTHNAVVYLKSLMEDKEFSENVDAIIDNLPKSDAYAITMAEANIMKPLLTRLIEGELGSKILMSNALSRPHMLAGSKEVVSASKAVDVLLEMVGSENDEASTAAVAAMENLSSVSSVCKTIQIANGVPILLKHLKSPASSNESKAHAAHVLSNILENVPAESRGNNWGEDQVEELLATFMSLMGPCKPASLQYNLIQGLIALANDKDIRVTAKTKMVQMDSLKLLASIWETATDGKLKTRAVQFFSLLSSTFGIDACSAMKERPESLNLIFEMLKDSYGDSDHAVAASILADFPVEDRQILHLLVRSNILPQLIKFLDSVNDVVIEATVGALVRFCTVKEHQKKLAEMKVIQKLVHLLSTGRSLTRERAAKALYYFSKCTPSLTKKPQYSKCWFCFSPQPSLCKLHRGACEVETTYCLVEAGAVRPLVLLLKEHQMSCVSAALDALSTLTDTQVADKQTGWQLIAREGGILSIIGLISSGTSEVQETCAKLCEQIMKITEYKIKYGVQAQMHVVGLAQRGSSTQKQIAGCILRQLEVLDSQSNYFSVSTAGNP